MAILRGYSIRKTLVLVLLLTSSSTLVLTTLGFGVNDWLTLRSGVIDRLSSQASIIGHNVVAAITFGDIDSAHVTLSSLKNENDIVGAVLFTNDGVPFTSYHRNGREISMTLPESKSGTINGDLFVLLPIKLEESTIGSILIVSELNYWRHRPLTHLATLFGLFLLSLLLAVLLSSRLQRIVTDPILKLAETARRITESKNYELRAEKLTRDEIGYLVDDFNGMLQQIQQRDKELINAQEILEEKVQERTWELTELTHELEHQAYHDSLTGLANRLTFDDHLKLAIDQAQRSGNQIAVLFLDLDRFKIINDTLGHAVGDKLLIEASNRLKLGLRSNDTLARLGGDEFAVLLIPTKPYDAGNVARKLIKALNEPITIESYTLHVTTSIGISIFPDDGGNAETIIKNADSAMYRSKDRGRNQFSFFTSEMNARAARRLSLENKLRDAITENKFEIYYQPMWDTKTRSIVGVEALLRWHDPDEGFIDPTEFIPLADECGLIAIIDEWVLKTACQEVLSWYEDKIPKIILSVNLSPANFIKKDLCKIFEGILSETGFPGGNLELEITEELFGPGAADINNVLIEMQKLGVKFSIDDFGQAYSSLSRLKQLPLNTLKIDQSFIRDLEFDSDDEVIVRTIITMAHNLNLRVVAEGIETEYQYEFVKKHNCDVVQGFLLSKACVANEMQEMLAIKNIA
ncbi:MAG: EAL domain-containing protein [Cellvibrionaceae bacterium]